MERKKLLTLIGSVCLIIVLSALPFMTACPAPPPPPPAEEEELPPPPPPPAKEKIVIGNVDAFTGVFAPGPLLWGTIWMETLIADYNANGGLYVPEYGKKLPIELIKYDSTSDTETLIRLTEKCMTEDKVDLMFAPWGTSQNFAVYSLYEKYKYPMIPHAMGSG
ncbi:MAG: ABC transporter substrate-binding protein, partial [Dehalococcoidia bacterium]|nr:ABC transporter substrate-binding protein [Dehalococcoidia bacterium]